MAAIGPVYYAGLQAELKFLSRIPLKFTTADFRMEYYKSPADWTPTSPNPFSADGCYGPEWICFRIDGVNRTNCCCGGGKNGPFTFILGADNPDLKCRLADFLRYNERYNLKPHRSLTLSPYMIAAVTAEDFPQQTWCPRTFCKAANNLFLGRICKNV